VPCPYCGQRNASEFRWGGEFMQRPDPNDVTPEQWRNYLYFRANLAGWITETWYHREGCGRYFRAERHTITNQIRATYIKNPLESGAGLEAEAAAKAGIETGKDLRR
jgi:heterotetrameric sarcosine oxidase delta subunit